MPCVRLFHASKQGPSPKLGAVGRSLLAIAPVSLVGVQGRSGSRSSLASSPPLAIIFPIRRTPRGPACHAGDNGPPRTTNEDGKGGVLESMTSPATEKNRR